MTAGAAWSPVTWSPPRAASHAPLLRRRSRSGSDIATTTTMIVDETRNMLALETRKGVRYFAKDECTFSFHIPSGEWVRVDGKLLVARSEDRVKKKLRKW